MIKIKGIKIELGGTEYVVPPLNLNALESLQQQLSEYSGGIDQKSISTVKQAVLSALNRNYPEVTMNQVGEFLDLGNMQDVMEAVMDVSGLKRKGIELGEAQAARNQ